ncbi:MAG: hypothetical protein ACKOQW_04475 [Phycisphaerales bacterium]
MNAGPYATPAGTGSHGGWGPYDHWAGEGINGTQWGRSRDGRSDDRRGDDRSGGGRSGGAK